MTVSIKAASVNHNTSAYMELMLRSLFAYHPAGLPLSLTVFDNASNDDQSGLAAYAAERGVPILPSGFGLEEEYNSHGEILRRFVLEHPDCTHYLFLDADVCFIQPNTLETMLAELESAPEAFAIGPRMSWDGIHEIPLEARQANPDICDARLHPFCALVRNTPLFRQVVDVIGLSCVKYLWTQRDEYLDTFKLMTRVMETHAQRHIFSSALALHFFSVSYQWDTEAVKQIKDQMRDRRLAELRAASASAAPASQIA
jgi:hypothetical protein